MGGVVLPLKVLVLFGPGTHISKCVASLFAAASRCEPEPARYTIRGEDHITLRRKIVRSILRQAFISITRNFMHFGLKIFCIFKRSHIENRGKEIGACFGKSGGPPERISREAAE